MIQTTDAVELLSELGLAFLFLLAGYEIDPKQLSGHQGKVGLITWAVSLGIAWLAITLIPYFTALDMNSIAVVIALTTTALGTLMPILKERGLEGTPVGNAIISYGTWGELGPVLAMAILLSTRAGWQTLLVLGAFAAICVVCARIPAKARKAGHRAYRFLTENANTSSQTMMRMTVFLLVFLVTVSALFKLDVVLGAFAAGFILRYIIPDGMESLEMKLDGVGYGFLIPVFFVVSGAAIDVRAVAGEPGLLVTFIVMLMLIRTVPVYIAMSLDRKANPMSSHHRVTVALYCTTALPIIVAVTSLAVKAGTMQQSTASTLVAAGAITVFLMPLLGSLTYQVADVHPVTAVREIAHQPGDWRHIVHDHAEIRKLLHHRELIDRLLERNGLDPRNGAAGETGKTDGTVKTSKTSKTSKIDKTGKASETGAQLLALARKARHEIDSRLEELGLDPETVHEPPHDYRLPKN